MGEFIFLLGVRDDEGTFWCQHEFDHEREARNTFARRCAEEPHIQFELVQQIKMNKVLETHYPKKKPFLPADEQIVTTKYTGNIRWVQKERGSLKLLLQHEVIREYIKDRVSVEQKVEWVSVPVVWKEE